MRILGLVLILIPILSACAAAPGGQEADRGHVARIEQMQAHLESLRARGAIQPEKYEASRGQLDELRRAQGR